MARSKPSTSAQPGEADMGRQAAEPAAARPSRVQMADIARLAGVSVSTVSRALSDSPLLSPETRERIHTLARAMNYSINVGAQNLRLKQNRTVAVVVPFDPSTRQPLSDPFFLSMIGSLADALTAHGYDMLLTRIDADRLDLAAQLYHTGRAMGIVLIGQWHHHDQLNAMADKGLPMAVWGARLARQRYATVGGDNIAGGRLATAHLLAQGARRVLFLGDTELPEIGQRCEGWRDAHAMAGVPLDLSLSRPLPFVTAAIEREVEQMLREGLQFDAIFAASDLMAMTVISTLRRLGRSVPEDALLVGYDDIALAAHFHPPLSTVRQPIEQAGVLLVESLLAQLAGEPSAPKLLPTELVVRRSSVR
jgi:DNA-binding LacI/PurR family transcriptional regulator